MYCLCKCNWPILFQIFSHVYILQMLQKFHIFLAHLPGHGFSAHYLMQMLWLFSGRLPRHQDCLFQVFVQPADALEILHFPGTFLGLSEHYIMQMLQFFLGHLPGHQHCFILGFPHSPRTCASFLHVCNIFI